MDAAHGEKLQVKTCHFCEEFRIMKELEREKREKWEKNEARAFDLTCLLERTVRIWNEGEPKKTHAGDHLSKGFKLRFCPECGRRIQGKGRR